MKQFSSIHQIIIHQLELFDEVVTILANISSDIPSLCIYFTWDIFEIHELSSDEEFLDENDTESPPEADVSLKEFMVFLLGSWIFSRLLWFFLFMLPSFIVWKIVGLLSKLFSSFFLKE